MELFLFVCVFLEQKYIFSYTFDICGRLGDKKFFTRSISGNKTTFFGLVSLLLVLDTCLDTRCQLNPKRLGKGQSAPPPPPTFCGFSSAVHPSTDYHKLNFSWKFHWNSCSSLEDIKIFFFNFGYLLSSFWKFWDSPVAKKLMKSAYNRWCQ